MLNKNSSSAAVALEETAASLEQITSNIGNNTQTVIKMSQFGKKVKNSVFFRNNNVQHVFSADLFGRVIHQLDQKCRDVEPGAYNMN